MKRLLLTIVLLLITGSAAKSLPAKATTNSTWVNQQSLNIGMGEQASAPPEIGGQPCFQTTFKVKKFTSGGTQNGQTVWKEAPDQQVAVCAIQSGVGLVAYHSGGTYIQFPGSAHAIRIHSNVSNFIVTVIPVSGSRTTIVQTKTSTSSSPAATHIFYNLLGVGDVTISGGEAIYYIRSFPERFLDQSGNTLDMSNFAFSSDSEWMVAIVRSAIMRIRVKTKEMQTIARGFIDVGIQYKLAITNDGRYVFAQSYHSGTANPIIYDLQDCQPSQQYNYGQVPQTVPGCGARLIRNNLLAAVPGFLLLEQIRFSYDAQVLSGFVSYREQAGAPVLKKRITITRSDYVQPILEYLALGDSFSSGEGDTEGGTWYKPGTDTDNNKCHMSRRSYPYLVAEQIGLHEGPNKPPAEGSLFRSIACSGAVSLDVTSIGGDYEGQVRDGIIRDARNTTLILREFSPGFIGQIEFASIYDPKTATISIIGNDIGFRDKLIKCLAIPGDCYPHYEDRLEIMLEIKSKYTDLVNLYQTLQNESPDTRIYALGYPQIFSTNDTCNSNALLSHSERELSRGIVHYLNATIKAAAERAGVMYIDVENAFVNRQLCDGPNQFLAVNGLTAGNDVFGVLGNESFHPNPVGHTLMAEKVIAQTGGLTQNILAPNQLAHPPDPFAPQFAYFLTGPHRGGPVYLPIYEGNLSDEMILRLDAQSSDLVAPGSGTYDLVLFSEPVTLGSFTPDEDGMLYLSYTIPDSVNPGFHTLHLFGNNAAGDKVDMYKTIFVTASNDDYDGDGVPNNEDSCDMLQPTGVDEDQDSIDDACDSDTSKLTLPDNTETEEPEAQEPTGEETNSGLSEEDPKPPINNEETVAGRDYPPGISEPSVIAMLNTSAPPASTAQSVNTQSAQAPTETAPQGEDAQNVLASTATTPATPSSQATEFAIDNAQAVTLHQDPWPKVTWVILDTIGFSSFIIILIFRHYTNKTTAI